ncbi:MAG: hypothetical protein JO108_33505 [Acidobacteriaceae bacterium]|nr:hypothetical protein [Acidobacteriaceae bacterium]
MARTVTLRDFNDPDDNMIEVYWPTGHLGRKPLQPYMEPLDLSQSDRALLKTIRATRA